MLSENKIEHSNVCMLVWQTMWAILICLGEKCFLNDKQNYSDMKQKWTKIKYNCKFSHHSLLKKKHTHAIMANS